MPGQGTKKQYSQAQKDFIRGKTDSAQIEINANKTLGYSPTLETKSGAGFHEPAKKIKRKRERREGKRQSREW